MIVETRSEAPKNNEAQVSVEGQQPSGAQKEAYHLQDFRQAFQKLAQADSSNAPALAIDTTGPLHNSGFGGPDHRPYNQRLVEKQNGVLQINVNFRGASQTPYVGSG